MYRLKIEDLCKNRILLGNNTYYMANSASRQGEPNPKLAQVPVGKIQLQCILPTRDYRCISQENGDLYVI